MMHLGADGVFVGSGIFKSDSPEKFARAIVEATTHFEDFALIAEVSKNLEHADEGIEISSWRHPSACRIAAGKKEGNRYEYRGVGPARGRQRAYAKPGSHRSHRVSHQASRTVA